MRVTIIRDDGVVGVGGVFRRVDLSGLPEGVRALQWESEAESGHLEYDDATNAPLTSIADFNVFIDRWTAAAKPITPTPATGRQSAYQRINSSYEVAMRAITTGYPESEIKSWDKQEAEARAWFSYKAAPTPWIDAAAAARGIAKEELVQRILAKADAFAVLHGQLTGKRQALEDRIAALGDNPTQEQLDAIQW